jgi:hypothetical protein
MARGVVTERAKTVEETVESFLKLYEAPLESTSTVVGCLVEHKDRVAQIWSLQ